MRSVCSIALLSAFISATVATAMPGTAAGAELAAQVRVESVEVLATPVGPVVVLRVRDKAVPIFVDVTVAQSIQGALSGQKPPRPLTHDLMRAVIEGLGAKVTRIEVTLKDKIFYAALSVGTAEGVRVFDSRSSDAIALAIHFKAPILVTEELVEAVGVELRKPGETRS